MTLVLRLSAWLLAAAVTFATLGPAQYRPHSSFGQDGEHALAFVLVGLAFAFAYPRQRLLATGIAVVMVGLLEVLQLFVPGRHARVEDFAVDALATCCGFALAGGLTFLAARTRSASAP
jgi:VanZ like family